MGNSTKVLGVNFNDTVVIQRQPKWQDVGQRQSAAAHAMPAFPI